MSQLQNIRKDSIDEEMNDNYNESHESNHESKGRTNS